MTDHLEVAPGENLRDTVSRAHEQAMDTGQEVRFKFNEWHIHVLPTESWEEVKARVEEETGIELLTRAQMAKQAGENLERRQREADEAMAEAGVPDEKALREAKVPWPESLTELAAYISSLVDRPHDYGTCVYAMSMSALAAYYYVSKQLGVTGFQASMADMDLLRRNRHMEMGFRIVNYADMLYPQYWKGATAGLFAEALQENEEIAKAVAEKAQEYLAETKGVDEVRKHWQILADGKIPLVRG